MSLTPRKTHMVPTHLHTPETVFSFGGLSVSARQFLLLLIGAALGYDLWLHLAILAFGPAGMLLRLLFSALPVVLSIALAFLRLAGRSLERWLLVFLRAWGRPKQLVWRSVRFQESIPAPYCQGQEKAYE